jgi:hypothetical protein
MGLASHQEKGHGMADVGLGGTIPLRATFRDGNGDLFDPVDPVITVTDSGLTVRVAGGTPSRESLGRFLYEYTVPADAALGTWAAAWSGTINGAVVAGGESFKVGAAGTVSSFSRWNMTVDKADKLTGGTLNDDRLIAAEEEIVDFLGWRPDPDDYDSPDPVADVHDVRAFGFGKAIAWQAAYRATVAATANDGAVVQVTEESIGGDYSFKRTPGTTDAPVMGARARTLLVRGGFTAASRSGTTRL